ncbi:YraN family protein [bacterium]|nr:YraN family protein [bacterium]
MSANLKKGLEGEDTAARYLVACGYSILGQRWRHGRKEIDLVAARGPLTVFVEVKRRLNDKFGPVRLTVDSRKRRNLAAAAEGWLHEHGGAGPQSVYRFDVILLHPPDAEGRVELEHIEDAFRP